MKKITILSLISVLFFSCSSDDAKSSANYIESFSLPNIKPVQITIINEQNKVHVLTYQDISGIEPDIVPSKGASVKKEKAGNYTIIAENGDTRTYSVVKSDRVPDKNSFENWGNDNGYDYLSDDLNWTSGNAGISTVLQMLGKGNNYPTKETKDGYKGHAVVLETIEGGKIFNRNMPILSGNFFLGNFNTSIMVSDELAATEFGKLYFAKPKKITGYYKYKEGKGDGNDFCDIYAALYKASKANGEEIILTAKDDLEKSSLVYARVENCSETEDFQEFTLDFGDYSIDEKYNYKLIITFASSKDGAKFEGKIGSKLIVDEVVIEDYP